MTMKQNNSKIGNMSHGSKCCEKKVRSNIRKDDMTKLINSHLSKDGY